MKFKNITGHMYRKKCERNSDYLDFKPFFYRFIGVEDALEYDNIIKTLQSKSEEYKDSTLIFDNSIPLIGEMELIQYIYNELFKMNISNMINQDIVIFENMEVNIRFLKALDFVIPIAIEKENFFNDSVRNNFITKLIVWAFNWVKDINFDGDIIPKCIYYGNIQKHEIYFLILLYKMGFDVIYINPLKEEYWNEIDTYNLSEKVESMGIVSIESFEEKAQKGEVIELYETITKQLQNEIDEQLFTDTGMYKPWQFRTGYTKSILLDTILEDIYIYWNEPCKLRYGFKVEGNTVRVPNIFYKIDGVYNDPFKYQKLVKFCVESQNTLVINNRNIIRNIGADEDIYQVMFCQLSNGEFDIDEIKKLSIYKYSKYSKEVQDFILKKFNETIMSNDIYTKSLNKEDILKLLTLVLGLDEDVIRMIDNFDFTGNIPKIVVFIDNEDNILESTQLILGYLHTLGMDIVIFNPSGFLNLGNILNNSIFNTDRLEAMKYDVEFKKVISLRQSVFSRFLK